MKLVFGLGQGVKCAGQRNMVLAKEIIAYNITKIQDYSQHKYLRLVRLSIFLKYSNMSHFFTIES